MDESTFIRMCEPPQYVSQSQTKVLVQYVVSGKGTDVLYSVKGMMNQHLYKDILEKTFNSQCLEWFTSG